MLLLADHSCARTVARLLLHPTRLRRWRLGRHGPTFASPACRSQKWADATLLHAMVPHADISPYSCSQRVLYQQSRNGSSRHSRLFSSRSRVAVHTAAASPDKLLKGMDPEFRDDVARIIDTAERAAGSWQTAVTDFHAPPVVAMASAALDQLAGVGAVAWGGYPQAERCRMLVGRDDALPPAPVRGDADFVPDSQLAQAVMALSVSGNFMFDAATHRDFLGALLGTGIDRSKVGDVLLTGDRGAQILVAPTLADFLCTTLAQASMRLDALASAGFRVSRSKMMETIKRGEVRVNWRTAKASATLKAGDVVSCSGRGRLEIGDVSMTKKSNKYVVELARWM